MGGAPQNGDPLLFPFAADAGDAADQVDVPHVKPGGFADAESAGVDDFDHRQIPGRGEFGGFVRFGDAVGGGHLPVFPDRFGQKVDLVDAHHQRQRLIRLDRRQLQEGVVPEQLHAHHVAEEAAQGGKLALDRAFGIARFKQGADEPARLVALHLTPGVERFVRFHHPPEEFQNIAAVCFDGVRGSVSFHPQILQESIQGGAHLLEASSPTPGPA